MPIGNLPEILSQRILVGRILAGRLSVDSDREPKTRPKTRTRILVGIVLAGRLGASYES